MLVNALGKSKYLIVFAKKIQTEAVEVEATYNISTTNGNCFKF